MYNIQSGDTLSKISAQFGVGVSDIMKANPQLKDPNKIQAGAQLNIPNQVNLTNKSMDTLAPNANAGQAPANTMGTASNSAGAAGLGIDEWTKILTPSKQDQEAQRNSLAQTLGFTDYNTMVQQMFTKPSKTTQQTYEDAYNAAGLPTLLASITQKKNELAQAEGAINDNPWLSEANRVGKVKRVQELANANISNLTDEYNAGLNKISELIKMNQNDFTNNNALNEARLGFLQKELESKMAGEMQSNLAKYLPEYLAGKESTAKPVTMEVGEGQAVYQYDKKTGAWKQVAYTPKTYKPTGTGTSNASIYYGDIQQFMSEGDSPDQAVQSVIAMAKELGNPLSDAEITELRTQAQAMKNGVAPTPTTTGAPAPKVGGIPADLYQSNLPPGFQPTSVGGALMNRGGEVLNSIYKSLFGS